MKPSLKSDLPSLAAIRGFDLQAVDGPARAQGLGREYDDILNHAVNSALLAQVQSVWEANATAQRAMETLQAAEEGIGSVKQIVQRMDSLATQNANSATLSVQERYSKTAEFDALHVEVDRIVACASYRGQRLLAGECAVHLRFRRPSSGDNGRFFSLSLPNLGTAREGLQLTGISIDTVRDAVNAHRTLETALEALQKALSEAALLRRQIADAVRESNLRFLADASRGWEVDHVDLYENSPAPGPDVAKPTRSTASTLRDGLRPPSSPGTQGASRGV